MFFLGKNGIPFSIIFTKSDKHKQKNLAANVKAFKETLYRHWEELPPYFITSAEKRQEKIKSFNILVR